MAYPSIFIFLSLNVDALPLQNTPTQNVLDCLDPWDLQPGNGTFYSRKIDLRWATPNLQHFPV
jgi:hypothetical protein